MKPYRVVYLHEGKIHTMYLYGLSKHSLRNSIVKHWNESLVFDVKVLRIEDTSEEELWREYEMES